MSEHLPPSSRRLRRMASDYEESFPEARAEQLAAQALARARVEELRPRRRLAVLVGVASVMFALVGLGYGSGKSLPGDSLYGVSRTYERFGQLVGVVDPVQERLHEVIALAERGDRELAAQTASEALDELGRQRGVNVSITPTVATTPPSPPTTALTVPPTTAREDEGTGPTDTRDDTTTTTVKPAVTVDADESIQEDPVKTLKLAAELLLDRVKENGDAVDDAAANLAVAVSALASQEDTTTVAADEPTENSTDSTTSSTTSTSQPKRNSSTSTTSTTSSTTSTTSTTTPTEGPPGQGEGPGSGEDGPGPIVLPPEF